MSDLAPSSSFDGMQDFLQKIAGAVQDLRTALEANDMNRLPAALDLTNAALDAISIPAALKNSKGILDNFLKIKHRY